MHFGLRPGQKCHSKVMHLKEVTHSNGSYDRKLRGRKLADEMGRGKKIPMVHSWTDAPEESDLWTAWQLFPLDDDQTRDFEDRVGDWVDAELLYNSVKTEVKTVAVTVGEGVIDEVWSGKPHQPKGLRALMIWGLEKMLIRCSKESHQPAEWTPGPPVEHREKEKDTTLKAIRMGV